MNNPLCYFILIIPIFSFSTFSHVLNPSPRNFQPCWLLSHSVMQFSIIIWMCSDPSKGLYTEAPLERWILRSACTHVIYSFKWRADCCHLSSCCFSVFKFISSLSLLCSAYNWDLFNNSQYEGLNNATWSFLFILGVSFAISPPLLPYTKLCEKEDVAVIYIFSLIFQLCGYGGET